jgi:hypothetical protein
LTLLGEHNESGCGANHTGSSAEMEAAGKKELFWERIFKL